MIEANREKISIHPPREGRDGGFRQGPPVHGDFNPPSPCGEGQAVLISIRPEWVFQSTLPARGGTYSREWATRLCLISIHPPRGGRDINNGNAARDRPNFNPPSPWGEGPNGLWRAPTQRHFNPPSPWGEGPLRIMGLIPGSLFQSTLPVGGGTWPGKAACCPRPDFNPPSPWGEGPKTTPRSGE